jgi:hypothetical protein
MSQPDARRDARLAAITLPGKADLLTVRQKTVAVVGLGTLGGPVVDHFAMLGVPLVLLDQGVVEPENLGTQGFAAAHVGLTKVQARTLRVQALHPAGAVRGLCMDIEHMGAGAFHGVDAIVCCLDGFAARMAVNELAWRLGIPWVDAALDGSGTHLFGRVMVYDPRQPEAACLQCSWDARMYARVLDASGQGCPTWLRAVSPPQEAPPTLAISSMAGIVAGWQTLQTLRRLGGDTSVVGHEVLIDAEHGLLHTATVRRTLRCRFDHQTWSTLERAEGTWQQPVHTLFISAEAALGSAVTLHAHRRTLATSLLCGTCGRQRSFAKFVHALQPEDMRCPCGGMAQPVGFSCLTTFDRPQASAFLDASWQQLGLPVSDVVTASTSDGQCRHYVMAA